MSLVVPIDELFSNEEGLLAKASHWPRIDLGKVANIVNGYPLKSTLFNKQSGFPIIRIRDLKYNRPQTFTKEEFPKEYIVSNGDLLIGMDGDFICYKWSGGRAVLNQRVCKIIPNEEFLDPQFLFYAINGYLAAIHQATSSVTVKHLSSLDILKIPFPLPPRQEQARIVAKLDELMEKIDRSRARLERIPKILKRFRQSVLNAAITGKLTEDWRREIKDVPSVDLELLNLERERLQRKRAEERGQKSFSYKQPVEIEIGDKSKGVDELFEIPDSWKWASLDQTVWSISDGPHFSPKYVDEKEGVPFISSRNVSYKRIDFSDAKFVTKKDHLEFIKRGKSQIGDVLLTKGGTTGIAHVVDTNIEFSIWVHVALLKVISKYVNPKYLRDVLTSDFLYRQSQAQTHGVGNQDLGLTRMIFMTIPLPPIEEQDAIVKKIEQLFALADKIEARYISPKRQVDNLPQSLLSEAFRGELVNQDKNDEPAETLLQKIKAQKASIQSKKSTAKDYVIDPVTAFSIAADSNGSYQNLPPITVPENKKAFAKQVLGGKIVSLFKDDPHFTHIKFQKLQYLAEHLAEVDLNWNYYRQSAGPYDPKFMHTVAVKLKASKWFEERKYKFYPLERVDKVDGYFDRYFKPAAAKLGSLFAALKNSTEDEAEIVATLYAVWNNRIIKKEAVNDDIIVSNFFEWSDRKKKYTPAQVAKALAWMKKSGFVPTGFGKVIKEKKK